VARDPGIGLVGNGIFAPVFWHGNLATIWDPGYIIAQALIFAEFANNIGETAVETIEKYLRSTSTLGYE
jgi:hypothetical protein